MLNMCIWEDESPILPKHNPPYLNQTIHQNESPLDSISTTFWKLMYTKGKHIYGMLRYLEKKLRVWEWILQKWVLWLKYNDIFEKEMLYLNWLGYSCHMLGQYSCLVCWY